MNPYFCENCGHTTSQAMETEGSVFCPQCGGRMKREDPERENAQQRISASRPLTAEASSFPQELKRDPIEPNAVSALGGRNRGKKGMLFKSGDRVRYDGQDMDKLGLQAGMEGEVVRCFQSGVEVYFDDLRRVVHLMDFHMRISLKGIPPETSSIKEKRSVIRRIIRLFGLIALIILVVAIVIFIIKDKYPEILQKKDFLRYFRMR